MYKFIFLCLLILVSCGQTYTIRLEGEKDGIKGNIEFTVDPQKSATYGFPVLTSGGDTYYAMPSELISRVYDETLKSEIKTTEKISAKSVDEKLKFLLKHLAERK
jgi:hypothetical protein